MEESFFMALFLITNVYIIFQRSRTNVLLKILLIVLSLVLHISEALFVYMNERDVCMYKLIYGNVYMGMCSYTTRPLRVALILFVKITTLKIHSTISPAYLFDFFHIQGEAEMRLLSPGELGCYGVLSILLFYRQTAESGDGKKNDSGVSKVKL